MRAVAVPRPESFPGRCQARRSHLATTDRLRHGATGSFWCSTCSPVLPRRRRLPPCADLSVRGMMPFSSSGTHDGPVGLTGISGAVGGSVEAGCMIRRAFAVVPLMAERQRCLRLRRARDHRSPGGHPRLLYHRPGPPSSRLPGQRLRTSVILRRLAVRRLLMPRNLAASSASPLGRR